MPKRATGLYKRWSKDRQTYTWSIDKTINGKRLCLSTETSNLKEAERRLAYESEKIRQRQVYSVVQSRTFAQAAARFVDENGHKRSLDRDIQALDWIMPYIGELPLHQVHQGTVQGAIDDRRKVAANTTINRDLATVKRVLALAARLWRDENGNPWLNTIPMIMKLPETGKRVPYPLTWEEQRLLFKHLSKPLENMALFSVHTGMRNAEITNAKWSWEATVDGHSVLIIPATHSKNKQPRIVVCNRVAQSVLDGQRGKSGTWLFPSPRTGKPIDSINNSGWRTARHRAAGDYPSVIGGAAPWGFENIRVHDLRHTFGRRLRAADVSEEMRKDLLGHSARSVTTEYSGAEIQNLLDAVNLVCDGQSRPMLRVVG